MAFHLTDEGPNIKKKTGNRQFSCTISGVFSTLQRVAPVRYQDIQPLVSPTVLNSAVNIVRSVDDLSFTANEGASSVVLAAFVHRKMTAQQWLLTRCSLPKHALLNKEQFSCPCRARERCSHVCALLLRAVALSSRQKNFSHPPDWFVLSPVLHVPQHTHCIKHLTFSRCWLRGLGSWHS